MTASRRIIRNIGEDVSKVALEVGVTTSILDHIPFISDGDEIGDSPCVRWDATYKDGSRKKGEVKTGRYFLAHLPIFYPESDKAEDVATRVYSHYTARGVECTVV